MERRIRQAKFQVIKNLNTFDFLAIPALNKSLVLELARCVWIDKRENIIALGPSGVGNPYCACTRPSRLPEGVQRRVHECGVAGTRVDGGAR